MDLKTMRKDINTIDNENGFVLVAALLIMLVLTIIGIAATTNTSIELQIAGNDKVHKTTFYKAEGGALLGAEILEQNFSCNTGFSETDATNHYADLSHTDIDQTAVRVFQRNGEYILWNNKYPLDPPVTDIYDPAVADVAFPISNLGTGVEAGYLYMGGESQMQLGGALQMAAGYEGKGKSAAQGGVTKFMNIYSRYEGVSNSESIILLGWRHVVGMEETCKF